MFLSKEITEIFQHFFIGLHQHGMTMKQEVHSLHYIEDITKSAYSLVCDVFNTVYSQ